MTSPHRTALSLLLMPYALVIMCAVAYSILTVDPSAAVLAMPLVGFAPAGAAYLLRRTAPADPTRVHAAAIILGLPLVLMAATYAFTDSFASQPDRGCTQSVQAQVVF